MFPHFSYNPNSSRTVKTIFLVRFMQYFYKPSVRALATIKFGQNQKWSDTDLAEISSMTCVVVPGKAGKNRRKIAREIRLFVQVFGKPSVRALVTTKFGHN